MNNLKIGDKVPSFSLPSSTGKDINIADLKGKNIVIYFYPKDDTSGCTIEAKDFSCAIDQFSKLNTIILGISRDSLTKHNKFIKKHDLKHILLADETTEVCEKFSCWVEKSMYGRKYMGIARKTFLVNQDGIVVQIWPNVKITGHVDEVLATVKDLCVIK